jgi:hypothetical protein
MAGYIMTLDNAQSLRDCVENGVYSTRMTPPKGVWGRPHEATFADYVTMRPGDNIYFFIDRKIYGIGEIVNVGTDCRYLNYPQASLPKDLSYEKIKSHLLQDESDASNAYRWICLFKPSPYFFKDGIDMDDMLSSNPNAFRMLRVFWKLSFLKIDDNENQAFKDALLKFNQNALSEPDAGKNVYLASWEATHKDIAKKVTPDHHFDASPFLESCANGQELKHEMAIELGLLYQLATKHKSTAKIFGEWDYLHHQVVASPFKPVDYMDKMDVFGYAFVKGYKPTIANYLVGELKKDIATAEDVEQLMKYVDWVKDEYAFGNYSMIRAFLVAYDFSDDAKARFLQLSSRRFIVGRRPALSQEWKGLTLVKYSFNSSTKELDFSTI